MSKKNEIKYSKNAIFNVPLKVTLQERELLKDAIEYLFVHGFLEEMTTDKRFYTSILVEHAAKAAGMRLDWAPEENPLAEARKNLKK